MLKAHNIEDAIREDDLGRVGVVDEKKNKQKESIIKKRVQEENQYHFMKKCSSF